MLKRVMLVAGEASGDLHGSGVVRELLRKRPGTDLFGIGGDWMQHEGMGLVQHISSMSFMGFVEVVRHLGFIREVGRRLELLLETRRPDVVVLIDYPGFNLRLAERVKRRGIPVLYYISPQVWAWHRSRVRKMRGVVDAMKVVFPFEVDLYRAEGINVEFVGHPIVERIGTTLSREEFFRAMRLDPTRKLLALLPGSRVQELERILPTIVRAAVRVREETGAQLALGVAPNLGPDVVRRFMPEGEEILFVENATYDLMAYADAAVVTSGTATLETGWFATPMVVVYRTSAVTYGIGRMLVDVPYIGLVNIVAGEKVVPELVQGAMTVDRLASEAGILLTDQAKAEWMRGKLSVIRSSLGVPGASGRVADGVIALGEGS
jgi:lipid-A-disaccharide synthase